MAGDQPPGVVAEPEGVERGGELVDGGEVLEPEQLLLEGAHEALGAAVPSGCRTKAGLLSMPSQRSSPWKWSDIPYLTLFPASHSLQSRGPRE